MLAVAFVVGFLFVGVQSQAVISMGVNSDGTSNFGSKIPIGGNDKNQFSVFTNIARPSGDITKGIAWDNTRGDGLSFSHGTTSFGDQLTAAGRLNLVNNGIHKLDANALITQNRPTKFPGTPNFNTYGGNLDYMFKNKIGASVGASRTPFLQRTDLSAMGKYNIFRNPSSSLDLNAGLQRTITPHFSQTQPFAGLTFSKFFDGFGG